MVAGDGSTGSGPVGSTFSPFARRLFRMVSKQEEGVSSKVVMAAVKVMQQLVAAKEGRSLFMQVGTASECIRWMRTWLVSRRRSESAELMVHTLKFLITASAHAEIQAAILQAADFNTWMREMIEVFTRAREAEAKARPALSISKYNRTSGARLRANAQPTRRLPGRVVTHRPGGGDSLAHADVRELTALLLRNLALHRGNKNILVASDGNLKFLLSELASENIKVVAACSAAIWVVLHHCSRAKSALVRLGARAKVRGAARRMEELATSPTAPAFLAGLPSFERTIRHLAMVDALLEE